MHFNLINKNAIGSQQLVITKGTAIILVPLLLFFLLLNFACSERVDGNNSKKDARKDSICPEKVTDIDANSYTTVQIGDQCWMAENLKTTRYAQGSSVREAYVVHGDEGNADRWGRLYTWHAVSKPAGICPKGWRVAGDDDYQKLEIAVGMNPDTAKETGWRRTGNESRKLKKYDTAFSWTATEKQTVNSSGFSGIPSGARTKFIGIVLDGTGFYGNLWTANEFSREKAWSRSFAWLAIHPGLNKIYRGPVDKDWAFAVRCIKNNWRSQSFE